MFVAFIYDFFLRFIIGFLRYMLLHAMRELIFLYMDTECFIEYKFIIR